MNDDQDAALNLKFFWSGKEVKSQTDFINENVDLSKGPEAFKFLDHGTALIMNDGGKIEIKGITFEEGVEAFTFLLHIFYCGQQSGFAQLKEIMETSVRKPTSGT